MRYSPLLIFFFISVFAQAQKIPLVNSGEIMGQLQTLRDSSKYEDAINLLLTIPKRDTNYVAMLTELAYLYNSNKQYDKAILTAEDVLKKTLEYESSMLKIQAIAMFNKGEFEKSVSHLTAAIKQRPLDYSLIYALGTIYYDHKDYEKAASQFFKVLSINPYHAGCHLNLGRIGILAGHKTHAMLSFGMYLGINNSDNSRLVLLNNLLLNQVPDEGTITLNMPNGCDKLDQIIRSKIAMDKNFRTSVKFDAAVVNQFEMFFQQLNTLKTNANDPWIDFYLSIYNSIKEETLIEPYIYFLLNSSNNSDVKKWTSKNDKSLSSFYTSVNSSLKKKREVIDATGLYGFKSPIQAWYSDNNNLKALGKSDQDVLEGWWVYFGDAGKILAEGTYTKGKKTGRWKYYYPTGELKSDENYDNEEIKLYRTDGSIIEHFFQKNNVTEGDVLIYYASGGLSDKSTFKTGKQDGTGQTYYPSGKKKVSYQYANGLAEGEWKVWFDSDNLKIIKNYKGDKLHGKYLEYYANGKIRAVGNYVDGMIDGIWKYYYSNGKLEKEGAYKNDLMMGEWIFYTPQGHISGKGTLNDKGEWTGDKINYFEGKIYTVYTYKNDLVVKTQFTDWNGKIISTAGDPNGNFQAKLYYYTGQLNAEGAYKGGKLHGKWTYYFPEGGKLSEYVYNEGNLVEKGVEYYRNGNIRYLYNYENDQPHGYYTEYFDNGSIKQEGWYQNGLRQQQWITYYSNKVIETDYYYLNNNIVDSAFDYNIDGKKYITTIYNQDSEVSDVMLYNALGEITSKKKKNNGATVYETFFSTGKPKAALTILEGSFTGAITRWLPDGSTYYTFSMKNTLREGPYRIYHGNGELNSEGYYKSGDRDGIWTNYYCNGKLDYAGTYTNDLRDSTWTYYYFDGSVSSTSAYLKGDRHGLTRYFSPDGTLIVEKFFEEGTLTAYRTLQKNGKMSDWILFSQDASITAYYSSGIVAYEEHYKKGLLNGTRSVNFSSGKPCLMYTLVNGNYEGPYTSYYPNNAVAEKRTYHYDEITGIDEFYNPDGSLVLTETYVNGIQNGKVTTYQKGVKQKEFTFWAGLPE